MKLSDENVTAIAERMVEIQNKNKLPDIKQSTEEPQYTVKEVAAMSKKTAWTIRQHIKAGLINASKVGKSYLISENNYNKYINNEQ